MFKQVEKYLPRAVPLPLRYKSSKDIENISFTVVSSEMQIVLKTVDASGIHRVFGSR